MKNRNIYLIMAICLILYSCQQDAIVEDEISIEQSEQHSSHEKKQLYQEFAKSLAIAVSEEPALRTFLKDEGMKMFDNDYDILYLLVKDKIVTKDGLSFYQLITKYASNPLLIDAIDQELRLLNIYIPELPSGFSCETWNSNNEVPMVTYISKNTDSYLVYDARGDYESISNELIPGFPILVLKENERVTITNNTQLKAGSGINFEFSDEIFNGSNDFNRPNSKQSFNKSQSFNGRIPLMDLLGRTSSVASRYREFNNARKWQRDFIYYGIDEEDERGPFDNSYSEFIYSMRFLNADGLIQISDASDDSSIVEGGRNRIPGWTDGIFEFHLTAVRSAQNGTGETLRKVFTARGSDLFTINYDYRIDILGSRYYYITSITPKTFYPDNLEFTEWDLSVYGTSWKFIFEEFDLSQDITESFTVSSKLATNFGFDIGFGKKVKIGLKFGATQENSKSEAFEIVTREKSDFLGECTVDFGDPIFIREVWDGEFMSYETRKYSTGSLEMDLVPFKTF